MTTATLASFENGEELHKCETPDADAAILRALGGIAAIVGQNLPVGRITACIARLTPKDARAAGAYLVEIANELARVSDGVGGVNAGTTTENRESGNDEILQIPVLQQLLNDGEREIVRQLTPDQLDFFAGCLAGQLVMHTSYKPTTVQLPAARLRELLGGTTVEDLAKSEGLQSLQPLLSSMKRLAGKIAELPEGILAQVVELAAGHHGDITVTAAMNGVLKRKTLRSEGFSALENMGALFDGILDPDEVKSLVAMTPTQHDLFIIALEQIYVKHNERNYNIAPVMMGRVALLLSGASRQETAEQTSATESAISQMLAPSGSLNRILKRDVDAVRRALQDALAAESTAQIVEGSTKDTRTFLPDIRKNRGEQPDFRADELAKQMSKQGGRSLARCIPEGEARQGMAYGITLVGVALAESGVTSEGDMSRGRLDAVIQYIHGASIVNLAKSLQKPNGVVAEEIDATFSRINVLLSRIRFWDNRNSPEQSLLAMIGRALAELEPEEEKAGPPPKAHEEPDRRMPGTITIAGSWVYDALCAQTDPGVFFPEKGGSTRAARKVCDGCGVREACLDYALKYGELGVWGGTSEEERQNMRRKGYIAG